MTDQQTGQKIQIVTAVDASGSPKQQFILTSPDGAGTGKVILASPETSSAKQLIFTTSDNLVPGRIQVRPVDRHLFLHLLLTFPQSWRPNPSLEVPSRTCRPWRIAALAKVKSQQVRGKDQKGSQLQCSDRMKQSQKNQQPTGEWHEQADTEATKESF